MTGEQIAGQDLFQALLENLYNQNGDEGLLKKVRAKAWDHFLELGLPDRESEVFRYIRLHHLYSKSFVSAVSTPLSKEIIAPHIYPECAESVLIFVNGYYREDLSQIGGLPEKLIISSLKNASKTYSALLNNQWSKTLKEETDPFASLNAAYYPEGLFLYLPPKLEVKTPLQILHLVETKEEPMLLAPRVQLFAGSQSQLNIVSSTVQLSGSGYCVDQVWDFSLDEAAQVQFSQISCDESPNSWHFDALRTHLKRDSNFKCFNVTNGSQTVRNDYRINLSGENAEASLSGIWMLDEKREAHTHVYVDHQAPNCKSMQLFKGVLKDISRSSFEGKIMVRQAAQKTEAYQLIQNLLLSDRASADCKPTLEIFADDVKASHGATVGQLDAEHLFYLKTRGFTTEQAKNILIYGFCKDVIDKIPLASLKESLTLQIQQSLTK